MVSLVAFFFAPSEETKFDALLRGYLCSKNEQQVNDDQANEDFIHFKRWFDDLNWKEILPVENDKIFIPQCESGKEENPRNEKQVCGTVTSITEDGGIVDDHIYFNINEVTGFGNDDLVVLGDELLVHAVSTEEGGGWRAVTVSKLDKLQKDEWAGDIGGNAKNRKKEGEQGSMIGRIDGVGEDGVFFVEHDVQFFLKDCLEDYMPKVGDWVKAKVTRSGEIADVQPLRRKELIGKVNYTPRRDRNGSEIGVGSINNEVQFSFSVCEHDYWPRRNDEVQVKAIESKQGRYTWRAISVALVARERKSEHDRQKMKSSDWVLRGDYPTNFERRSSVPSFLPKYPIPENVRQCVENGRDVLRLLPALKKDLSPANYAARFSALLYLEEISADIEIRNYYLYKWKLERRGEFLGMHVPGLTDGRPSLSVGDVVILQELDRSAPGPDHHGFIHHIITEEEKLLIKFHATLQDNFEESDEFNVAFTYSRTPFRRCHLAIQTAQRCFCSGKLFPETIPPAKRRQTNILLTMNKSQSSASVGTAYYFNNKLNERQQQAVQRIMDGETRSLPYILFGPPGTGKTVTLVETILQLYHRLPWSRILVCAPSNSAVDVICERLANGGKLKESDMTRFNAFRRLEESIPESIRNFCRAQEAVEKTSRYRVVLTTCVNAGIFYSLQLPSDHFTHLCIDEAGQATEPEALIPIGLVQKGQIIMAGDPEQLGAVIMSPLAKMYGLEMSLLERIMLQCGLYARNDELYEDGYNPLLVTKLINNYRSHPHLLKLPSEMFYKGELRPCADEMQCNRFLNWPHLPSKGFPILFHGLLGRQMRESDCPSLMNAAEIVQAIRYVKMLIAEEKVESEEIGIITPYRKQVEKLRIMLMSIGINGVKVGSVEEFQGQERAVIIISTVRSIPVNDQTDTNLSPSVRSALGFVSNAKRFNVAITRAKSLMIILGNPSVLSLDTRWKALLQFCLQRGGYTGCDVSSIEF